MREATRGPREGPVETNVKAIELKDLWRRYKSTGDQRARERLVVAYSPLVKYVSGRMASGLPAHVEEADLISYGLVGLISAIERFDIEREIKFETYAITRIKGAIIDEPRSLDREGQLQAGAPPAARADRRGDGARAGADRRGVPGLAVADLQLQRRGARRAVDGQRRVRRP